MDCEDAIKELWSHEPYECAENLATDERTNAVDNDGSIEFYDFWMSTVDSKNSPLPRVVHPRSESKANALHEHLTQIKSQTTADAAHLLGLPMIVCFNGSFSSSGPLPSCGCNHCETCFHNNVLSLRKFMFHQKNEGASDVTCLESSAV